MVVNTRIMFLASQKFKEDDALRGAFLTTDDHTIPLEFKCTSSIQPTELQRALYGHILEHYVLVELIAMPLIRAAREKPDLILVRNPLFLELRPRIERPILCLLKNAESKKQKAEGRLSTAYGLLPSEQKDRLDVILTTVGAKRDSVIQALSKIQGLKHYPHQIVGQLPYTVGKNISKETAQKIRMHLEKAGATVKLVPSIQKSLFPSEVIQDDQILHSESGRFEPLMLIAHQGFPDDGSKQRVVLNQVFKQYNLIEPFDRIEAALEQIHAQNLDEAPQPGEIKPLVKD